MGTTMHELIEDRARFDLIRYANCWEDADVLLQAMEIKPEGTYLSVSSAGDNTLSLLSSHPERLIAADISCAQLACLDLKKAAFGYLDYYEVLQFLGLREAADRIKVYRYLSGSLSVPSRAFWDEHPELIKRGIIHVGKFENYFRIFRKWILPLVHGAGDIAELMRPKDPTKREEFYQRRWDTGTWKLIFRLFFSQTVMGRLGRDPEFFRYVDSDVAFRILDRVRYALTILPTHNNLYLDYILTGNFSKTLPHYLRPEQYKAIRENLSKLVLFKGGIAEALKTHRNVKLDGCNLSDIFEYMSYGNYVQHLYRLIDSSNQGARLVYWNMLAERSPPAQCRARLEPLEERALELFRLNKAFFYNDLRIEVVN